MMSLILLLVGLFHICLWGGLSGKRWSESKLKELGLFEGAIDVSGLAPYENEPSGSLIVKLVENAGGFSVGDYVSWTFAGRGDDADRGRGQITDLRVSGEVQVPQTDVTLTASEEEPVALIRTRSGKVVGQYTRNLRKIKKPEGFVTPRAGEPEEEFIARCVPVLQREGYDRDQALAICYSDWRNRFEELGQVEKYVEELFDFLGYIDELPVYSTPEEASEVAVIAGCEGYHEHQVGDFVVYMPCAEHEPSWDSLLQEAHDEWMKGRMIDGNTLEEGELDAIMNYLDSVALDVEFSQETFAGVTGGKQRRNVGNSISFLDTPNSNPPTKVRYRYVVNPKAPSNKSGTSRDFCRAMMSKSNVVYRKEDINNASIAGVNEGFGPGGTNSYNLFLYRGGNNCRHIWETVYFYKQPNGTWKESPNKLQTVTDLIKPEPTEGLSPSTVVGPLAIGAQFAKEYFADNQIIVGPAMIPDKLIYRIDSNGEYYVFFPKDVVQKIAYKYMENKYTDAANIEHNSVEPLKDVFVVESWLVTNPSTDKSKIYMGEEMPEGTWMVSMRVKNKEVWDNYVKTGLVKGLLSVEGFFIDMLVNKQTKE